MKSIKLVREVIQAIDCWKILVCCVMVWIPGFASWEICWESAMIITCKGWEVGCSSTKAWIPTVGSGWIKNSPSSS